MVEFGPRGRLEAPCIEQPSFWLFASSFPTAVIGQQQKTVSLPCKSYFEALYYDQGGYRLGLSESQIKWWEKNHEKRFPSLCYSEDIGKVHYLVMWTTMATRSIYSKDGGAHGSSPVIEHRNAIRYVRCLRRHIG